jgi:hypothetical protein
MVGSSTSSRRNPFAENQQSTIWSNFYSRLFSQWKSWTCCIEVALTVKEQAKEAKLEASKFKEVQSIETKDL